jgi:hypothetical protein
MRQLQTSRTLLHSEKRSALKMGKAARISIQIAKFSV